MLSKVDLIEAYGALDFSLDFYTDVLDPTRLLPLLQAREGNSTFAQRHANLNGMSAFMCTCLSIILRSNLHIRNYLVEGACHCLHIAVSHHICVHVVCCSKNRGID